MDEELLINAEAISTDHPLIFRAKENFLKYDDLIIKLLPSTTNLNHDNLYSRLLEICHYVASLSDRKALNVYNKITGVEYQ